MAKINKLQKSEATIYPLTIPEAVVDSVSGKTQKQVNTEFKAIQDGQLKIKNEVVNGDFKDGLSGFTAYAVSNNSVIKGKFSYTPTTLYGGVIKDISGGIGDILYLEYSFKTLQGAMVIRDWGITTIATAQGNGLKQSLSANYYLPTATVRILIGSNLSSNFGPIDIYNFMAINLTQTFGAGNEPTKAEMDELIKLLPNGYFEGDLQNKYLHIWQLNLIRQNRNAIVALGGTII